MSEAISTEGEGECECCGKVKLVRMYILPTLEAAFVCKSCREGKPDAPNIDEKVPFQDH